MDPHFRLLLGAEPDTVEPLLDYGYRAVWKAQAAGQSYIVKKDERPGVSMNEWCAHQSAQAHGIPVPGLVGQLEDPPLIAMRWVAGVPLHEASSATSLSRVGALLRRVHELPVLTPRREPLRDWVSEWFEAELPFMVEHGAITVGEGQTALGALRRAYPVLDDSPLCCLHGDCQSAHFLVEPATSEVVAILDWADAQHGPPDIDLAVLALFVDDALEPLLEGYGASGEMRRRLEVTVPLFQAVRGAGAYRWLETHGYPGYSWPAEKVRALGS